MWAGSIKPQRSHLLPTSVICPYRTVHFALVTGSEPTPGVIAAIQTFGDGVNLHPHLHFLVTEGEWMNYLEFIARIPSHIPVYILRDYLFDREERPSGPFHRYFPSLQGRP